MRYISLNYFLIISRLFCPNNFWIINFDYFLNLGDPAGLAQGAVMSLNIAHKACNKTLPLFILSSYFQWFSETRNQEMGHKKSRNGPLTRANGQTKANRVVPTHLGLSPQSVKTKINPNISVQKLYPPFLIHRVDRIMRGCEICLCCNCTSQEFFTGNGRWSNLTRICRK